MDLKEKIKALPSSSGIYLMKDSQGTIIYVGKSKNLKNRVSSYFQKSKNRSPKVEKLVMNLKDFEYILTDTEFEAFMLECKLIKKYKPRYNRLMKNPLAYNFIGISKSEPYPTLEIIYSPFSKDKYIYWGPYSSKGIVEKAVQGIKECCMIMCSNPTKKNSSCLNYSLGLCLGTCLGKVTNEQYREIIERIMALFNGSDHSIIEEMERIMLSASENFDFETAAKYRDYITALTSILNKKKVIEFAEENNGIILVEKLDEEYFKLFIIKGNKILYTERYCLQTTDIQKLVKEVQKSPHNYINPALLKASIEVNIDEIDEAQIIYSYLKSNKCQYWLI
ncbi:GIY-YIG nuclease family protein [Clostridium thermarum]|uniref:GIY-YIG nuclease family protein n=1 Tax=Clostridium thermarum TaxID=1716543 RepID=UPI001123390F|nr:GIY-YIG nuclease family protein [Clostridium thermarum]